MSQNQHQPLPRLPLTGEEPKPILASVDQVISEGVRLSPSLVKGRAGEGLVLPYNKQLTALARENRSNPTKAETKIWQEVLRMRQFAKYKFLRQKPIGGYIVDFYCSELRLVIEIDGDSHAEAVEYDEERTNLLNSLGLHVIRYSNDDVLRNIEGVYDDLARIITAISLPDHKREPA
jgi:very-short-patch-repair endonuclease